MDGTDGQTPHDTALATAYSVALPTATRSNLAARTGEEGDAAGARDQYAALLPILERVLGPEHPSTLAARGNLAHWTEKEDDSAQPGVD
jgi:hypothetical protein